MLAEKPIARDVAAAQKLIEYYKGVTTGATLAIAENFRFFPMFAYAREQAAGLGRVTHFSVRAFSLMAQENKYYGTAWRSKPDYQGGFLLDGGVHFSAATRLLLAGDGDKADTVHAMTDRVQDYLLPIDTVNAIIRTRSGATGTYQHSAGSAHMGAFEWHFGYEKGAITASGNTVTVTSGAGDKTSRDFGRTSAVAEEVAAWAQGLADGKPNPLQSVEEALADLEFLEKMFRSGENGGVQQKYELQ